LKSSVSKISIYGLVWILELGGMMCALNCITK
jgi:hypothetical protein